MQPIEPVTERPHPAPAERPGLLCEPASEEAGQSGDPRPVSAAAGSDDAAPEEAGYGYGV